MPASPFQGGPMPYVNVRISADGNTVETHIEQAQFGENAVRYQASLTFLGDAFKGLVSAIRGQ